MSTLTSTGVLAAFLVFCRVGACLMLVPGIGGRHLPAHLRLFLALAISLAFAPLVAAGIEAHIAALGQGALIGMMLSELATGALIGLLARIYILALQGLATAIAQAIGIATMPGISVEEDDPGPTIATLFAFTATTLIFMSDQHLEFVRGLIESYRRAPPGTVFVGRAALSDVVDQLTATFLLALRIASPFLIYSMLVNFAVGITNKFTPQIPVYFIATPFVTAGGMILLYVTIEQMLSGFLMAFAAWLKAG